MILGFGPHNPILESIGISPSQPLRIPASVQCSSRLKMAFAVVSERPVRWQRFSIPQAIHHSPFPSSQDALQNGPQRSRASLYLARRSESLDREDRSERIEAEGEGGAQPEFEKPAGIYFVEEDLFSRRPRRRKGPLSP